MFKTAPPSDTFELSLFGCGVGESAALHVGNGEWTLVDSCRLTKQGEPLSLSYLREIGINPASAVKLIVLTHWHDDHVDGASMIVEACPNARIALSGAFAVDEFADILGLYNVPTRLLDRRTSGVRELGKISAITRERMGRGTGRDSSHAAVPAQADLLLHRCGESDLIALAPSPGSIHIAREQLKALFEDLSSAPQQARVLTAPPRNDYSIVLWLRWAKLRVLLGGDLELTTDKGRGWDAVLACQQFPDAKARIVKVAHHGSPNGDHPQVWEELIEPNAHAVLTSYSRGIRPLPTESDLARIRERTPNAYYTSLPSRTATQRDRAVERTIQTVARRRKVLARASGHVRIRWPAHADRPLIELSGTARAVA